VSEIPTLVLDGDSQPTVVLSVEEAEPREIIYVLRRLVQRHPDSVGLIGRALLAEGRRFIGTVEGSALHEQIKRAPAFQRLCDCWSAVMMSVPDGAQPQILPSDALEILARRPELERLDDLLQSLVTKDAAP
jgi:hypothetical protein